MLIGNKQVFAIEYVPVTPTWESRYVPEQAGWAGLAIWVDGLNLCQHVMPDEAEVRSWLYVPLAPLADWFASELPFIEFEERPTYLPGTGNPHRDIDRWADMAAPEGISHDVWDDRREQWWTRHFLRAGADGSRIPDLAFVREAELVTLSWGAPPAVSYPAPVMLWRHDLRRVPWFDVASVIRQFVDAVGEQLRTAELTAGFPWADGEGLREEWEPELLEAYCGRPLAELLRLFEAGGLPDLLRTLDLDDATANCFDPATSPQSQILRDLPPSIPEDMVSTLRNLKTRLAKDASGWSDTRPLGHEAARPATSPEEAGQLAAIALREQLGLNGQPVADIDGVLAGLGIACDDSSRPSSTGTRMLAAGVLGGAAEITILDTERTREAWARRFEAARGLGHLVLDTDRGNSIGAASGTFAAPLRRRRSGAFAAEFLLPESALEQRSDGALDRLAAPDAFECLMSDYEVGARTAAYQLWNRGWLSSPQVRDELVDSYSGAR